MILLVSADSFICAAALDKFRVFPTPQIYNTFYDALDSFKLLVYELKNINKHFDKRVSPENTGTVFWDKDLAQYGYTLLSFRYSNTVQLVDMDGKTIYKWSMPFYKAWKNSKHVHVVGGQPFIEAASLYPNGDILLQYSNDQDTPYGYGLLKLDKNSKILWKYSANTHHDIYVDSKDNIYTLTQSFTKHDSNELNEQLPFYPILRDYIVLPISDYSL